MFVRKPDTTIIKEKGDEFIVINCMNGAFCTVNSMGAFFLSMLDGTNNIEDLATSAIQNIEGVSTPELIQDMTDFYKSMQENGFVRVGNSPKSVEDYPLESLHVEITMKCNERCLHCYLPNSVKNKGAAMPFNLFKRMIDDFANMGGEQVSLSGGEPLLHPHFLDFLYYCKSKNLKISVFSNLTLLDESITKAMKETKVENVQVSIYSMNPQIHDKITTVKGSLAKTLRAIDYLLDAGIEVQIACPVMSYSKDDVLEIMNFAKEKNIHLRMNALLLSKSDGDDSSAKGLSLTKNEIKQLYERLLGADDKYTRDYLTEFNNATEEFCNHPTDFLSNPICSAGISGCCVSSSGIVTPCPDWDSYQLGDLKKNSLNHIWNNSEKLKVLRRLNQQRNFAKCLECENIDFCKRCLIRNSQLNNGDLLCFNDTICSEAAQMRKLFAK